MENPDNRAFIIGSLLRLTGSVTILTIEIITGLRDDLIVTTKINVFYFYFWSQKNSIFRENTQYFLKYLYDFGIMCCAISRNFRGQNEKILLKLLILLLRMMSSRLCAMSQFIYLPFFKKNLFPYAKHFDFFEHTRVHGWLFYIILHKKMKKCPLLNVLCKIIYYQNRKIHSVSKKMSFLFICKKSSQ